MDIPRHGTSGDKPSPINSITVRDSSPYYDSFLRQRLRAAPATTNDSPDSPDLYPSTESPSESENGSLGYNDTDEQDAQGTSHDGIRIANLRLHRRICGLEQELESTKHCYAQQLKIFGLTQEADVQPRWVVSRRGRQVAPIYNDIPSIIRESTIGILLGRAHINFMLGDYDEMASRAKSALAMAKKLRFRPLTGRCHFILGIAFYRSHRFELAQDEFSHSWDAIDHYGISKTSLETWQATTLAMLDESTPKSPDYHFVPPRKLFYRTDNFFARPVAIRSYVTSETTPTQTDFTSFRPSDPAPTESPESAEFVDKVQPPAVGAALSYQKQEDVVDEIFLNQEILFHAQMARANALDAIGEAFQGKENKSNPHTQWDGHFSLPKFDTHEARTAMFRRSSESGDMLEAIQSHKADKNPKEEDNFEPSASGSTEPGETRFIVDTTIDNPDTADSTDNSPNPDEIVHERSQDYSTPSRRASLKGPQLTRALSSKEAGKGSITPENRAHRAFDPYRTPSKTPSKPRDNSAADMMPVSPSEIARSKLLKSRGVILTPVKVANLSSSSECSDDDEMDEDDMLSNFGSARSSVSNSS